MERCVYEHNGPDTILWSVDHPGVCARGRDLAQAQGKLPGALERWCRWTGEQVRENVNYQIVQELSTELEVRDGDSDGLFDAERDPLPRAEYETLKGLCLRSAEDFLRLYRSIPDPDRSANGVRQTFYGPVPRTAREMYEHTKNVNAYYFGEIDVEADNEGDILSCRSRGFAALEAVPGFLENRVFAGSWDEKWTLRKVLRRFLWHDRIHAKAMYRMALRTFGPNGAEDVFCFGREVAL